MFYILKNRIFQLSLVLLTISILTYTYYSPEGSKKKIKLYNFPFFIPRVKNSEEQVRNGIPLVIYESWQSHHLPRGMCDNIQNLLNKNPEFDFYLYSDEDCAKFIGDNFDKEVLDAFNMLRPGAFKSDLWRYCILYKKGGVYIDIKYYSLVPLIDLIDENEMIFVRDDGAPRTVDGCFYNGFIVSKPNNEVFKQCIDDIVHSCKKKLYKRNVLDVTGPCLLGRILAKNYTDKYIYETKFSFSNENGNSWTKYPGISYKGEVVLKHYESYRTEQKKSENELHYGKLYMKGKIYNN